MTREEIKLLRQSTLLTRMQFARILNVSYFAVVSWERGTRNISAIVSDGIRAAVARWQREHPFGGKP